MTTKPRYDPERHHRQSIRKPGWDYAGPGRYFVTVCSFDREPIFGDVQDGAVQLSEIGAVLDETWRQIAVIHRHVMLDAHIIMPNHIHGIILVGPPDWMRATDPAGRPAGAKPDSLGAIIAGFKSAATRRVNALANIDTTTIWQRGYHDRIIPDDDALERARIYIQNNPANWLRDFDHPRHARPTPNRPGTRARVARGTASPFSTPTTPFRQLTVRLERSPRESYGGQGVAWSRPHADFSSLDNHLESRPTGSSQSCGVANAHSNGCQR